MKYFSSSFKYFFKNFFAVILFALPAAFYYGFLLNPRSLSFLKVYSSAQIDNFGSVTNLLYNFKPLYMLICVGFFVLLVLGFSALASLIEYHTRTGRLSIKKAVVGAKKYLIPAFLFFLFLTALDMLLMLIFGSVTYFIQFLFNSIGATIPSLGYNIVALIYIFINALYVAVGAFFLVAVLNFAVTTGGMRSSISNTAHLFEGKFLSHFFANLLIFTVGFAPIILVTDRFYLYELVIAVVFAVVSAFGVVFNVISFFAMSKFERKDNLRSYFK